jgi:hypothetical protein
MSRNRIVEAKAKGKRLRAFEVSADFSDALDEAAGHLAATLGGCTQTQALEWLVQQGRRKIPRKIPRSA